MNKLKNIVRWFMALFYVQESDDEVIVSEFRTNEEFAETMRLVEQHNQRACIQFLPNSWVLGKVL